MLVTSTVVERSLSQRSTSAPGRTSTWQGFGLRQHSCRFDFRSATCYQCFPALPFSTRPLGRYATLLLFVTSVQLPSARLDPGTLGPCILRPRRCHPMAQGPLGILPTVTSTVVERSLSRVLRDVSISVDMTDLGSSCLVLCPWDFSLVRSAAGLAEIATAASRLRNDRTARPSQRQTSTIALRRLS